MKIILSKVIPKIAFDRNNKPSTKLNLYKKIKVADSREISAKEAEDTTINSDRIKIELDVSSCFVQSA
jgi:hypothetical protein